MAGQLIKTTSRGALRPLAYQGTFVTDCFHQITNLIAGNANLSLAHVQLFAEPLADPTRDTIDWYTSAQGVPKHFSSLSPEESAAITACKDRLIADIHNFATELQSSQDRHRSLSGKLLDLALQYPDSDCIVSVGEQPVIICWGLVSGSSGAEREDLIRQGHAGIKEDYDPILRTGGSQIPLAATAGTSQASVPPALAPLPHKMKPSKWGFSGCLRWLILLGILLFLLLLLLGAPRGCSFWPGFVPTGCSSLRGCTPSGCSRTPVVPDHFDHPGADSALLAELARARDREADLRRELDHLKNTLRDRQAACGDHAPPVITDDDKSPPPTSDNKKDEILKSLAGCYLCDTGLRSSVTNESVVVRFCFDAQGKGYSQTKERNQVCKGPASISIGDDGKLYIDSERERCPNGIDYSAQRIVCDDSVNFANCIGQNKEDKSSWEAKFQKIDK